MNNSETFSAIITDPWAVAEQIGYRVIRFKIVERSSAPLCVFAEADRPLHVFSKDFTKFILSTRHEGDSIGQLRVGASINIEPVLEHPNPESYDKNKKYGPGFVIGNVVES